jgi:hypothetical protein
MRRGFIKARQHEPQVKAPLAKATPPQRIGILAQKGVYEFHHHLHWLTQVDGVEKVARLLGLSTAHETVKYRVLQILRKYQNAPLLLGKRILELTSGDEGFPKPIVIEKPNYGFRLYATMDCIFIESDSTLHILDFKTGKSAFDNRQALVYLLAAGYLYPDKSAVASFYNLEICQKSELITISNNEFTDLESQLANIAHQHQEDLQQYEAENSKFSRIFPPNPGNHCRFCAFSSICEFADLKLPKSYLMPITKSHHTPSSS